MNKQPTLPNNPVIYYRLIALWVLNEAMLGGIIHGFKLPVSGLIVGGCAVICICLIAWYVPQKGAILKATIIVAIFKMMLSPQAPPPAYIAVFFQGLLGELLFWNRRFFKISCVLLGILGLLESGLQRILMLTIIYGKDVWVVVNDFINGLTKQTSTTNYSLLVGSAYVFIHVAAGAVAGWWSSVLPKRVIQWSADENNRLILTDPSGIEFPKSSPGRTRIRKWSFVIWIILIILYIQSYFELGTPLLPSHISLKIFLRSVIIILAWVFVVGPLLKRLLRSWLTKKQSESQRDIQQVLSLLPVTRQLVVESWRTTNTQKGWRHIKACAKKVLVNALHPVDPAKVFILSGPLQTGKTTSLIKRTEKRNDVAGVLTPVVDGRRMFMNVQARQLFEMEASPAETDVLQIGKYVFSRAGFDKAIRLISDAKHNDGWVVIDEIGPLELKGEGFANVLKEILVSGNQSQKILLVVREGLVEQVKEYFGLDEVVHITNISVLR